MPIQRAQDARFDRLVADSQEELIELMNNYQFPYARVVYFGAIMKPDMTLAWAVVFDKALTLVLTRDDIYEMEQMTVETELEESSDEVLKNTKLNMAA